MPSSLCRCDSRHALLLPTILGFHCALFWLVASGLAPRLLESLKPDPAPVMILPRQEERIIVARPGPTTPLEYSPGRVVKPVVTIPEFTEQPPQQPAINEGRGSGPDSAMPRPPEFVPPGLSTLDRRLATVVEACYPAASRRLGEEGRTIVHLTIGADGRPRNWRVARTSGFARLDAAAGCVIERLEFEAGRRGGSPVDAQAEMPILFRLK